MNREKTASRFISERYGYKGAMNLYILRQTSSMRRIQTKLKKRKIPGTMILKNDVHKKDEFEKEKNDD